MILYIIMGIIVLLLLLVIIWIIRTYNHFVVVKNRVANQGAQIDVQLKRRSDLIPNLIETTKGYAKYEKDTLTEVTRLRSRVMEGGSLEESWQADRQLGQIVGRMLALGESYPELKANANFLQLQQELSETEDKIAKARQFYNDVVSRYNTDLELFPQNLIAGMLGFRKSELLQAKEQERENVTINADAFQF